MAYDWRPTASRTATTLPRVVAPPAPAPDAPPAPPEQMRIAPLVEEFIAAMRAGVARNRSGRAYRPSALRDVVGSLNYHVVRDLGDLEVRQVRREHVQALIDRMAAEGLSASRIRSVVSALRALYHYAIDRGYADFTPADGLAIPRDDAGVEESWSWTEPAAEGAPPRVAPPPPPPRERDRLEPLALLPERVLSLVLRIAIFVFVLLALISLAESS